MLIQIMDTALQAAIDSAMQKPDWEAGESEVDVDVDEDEEYDTEAEEIAKRLGDQLWADIAKAQAEASASANTNTSATNQVVVPPLSHVVIPERQTRGGAASEVPSATAYDSTNASRQDRKQEAALVTIRTILSFAFKDPVVRTTLASQTVPAVGSSVLDILTQCANSGTITKIMAKPLSDAVVSLAKSDVLFSSMRNSDAAAIQLDKGKRKRDVVEVDPAEDRYQKRLVIEYPDVLTVMTQAVRAILYALSLQPSWTKGIPDPAFISSIQFPLHQVYLFSATSAPRAKPEQVGLLQELAGLIQMLGVLSKIPIGPAPTLWEASDPSSSSAPDIGTAVYPCLVPGCTKTFQRLYSLRTHQRLHALVDRPYKCASCPASFARNHDLKRHVKLHDKTAWKCLGCDKVFSRRDAIKRHKDSRSKGGKGQADSACVNAGIEQVEVEKVEDEEDVTRRVKMWNGIVATQMANASAAAAEAQGGEGLVAIMHVETASGNPHDGVKTQEEGEIPQHIIEHSQATVLQLYSIIKSRVGPSEPLLAPPAIGAPGAQSTLASVIARTQSHYRSLPSTEAEQTSAPSAEQSMSADKSLPLSWLTEEQTKLLEQAIAQAASAAQAQAEAEAALEEEEDELLDEEDEEMESVVA
jgi:hypothetical protein